MICVFITNVIQLGMTLGISTQVLETTTTPNEDKDMAYAHSCKECNPEQVRDASTEYWHSTYLGHPITYGFKVSGKKCWHSNALQESTLKELKERIKSYEDPFNLH